MESRFYEATRVEAPSISALSKLSLSPTGLRAQLVPCSSRVPTSNRVSSECKREVATPTFEYIDGVANEQPVDAFHEQLNVVLQCKKCLAQLVERTRHLAYEKEETEKARVEASTAALHTKITKNVATLNA
ncbi:unnamed protein product [Calypogeia fissa]